jgi:hypothetical protein
LRGLANSIKKNQDDTAVTVSMIVIGDSFTATGSLAAFNGDTRVVGYYKSGSLTGGGDSGVTTINDYTRSPSGSYFRIADGGNLTAAYGTSGAQGHASHVYYTFFNVSGAGSAQLQYKKGAGAWTSVGSAINTATGTVAIGSVALPDVANNYAVRVVASGGHVNGWIGMGLNGPGLTVMDFATEGHGIEQVADISETIWKAMIAGYQTAAGSAKIVFSGFADYRFTTVATTAWPTKGVPAWSATSPSQTLHDWSKAQDSTIDWLVVGPHQVSTAITDSAVAEVDAAFSAIGIGTNLNDRTMDGARAQREFAVRNNTAFCDAIYLTDYASGNAQGLYGDTIHLVSGQNLKRALILKETNLGVLFQNRNTGGVKVGQMSIVPTALRSVSPGIAAYLDSGYGTSLVPWVGSAFRVGDSVNTEQSGIEFAWHSANLARIRAYTSGGSSSGALEISYNGAGISLRPAITASSQCGTMALPWAETYTKAFHRGYVGITSAFPVSAASEWAQISVIQVTGSGTFNVTLPLSINAYSAERASAGREISIINNGSGTVTVATTTDGTNLQKINTATTYELAPGASVKLLSVASTYLATNYGNWITIP